VAPAAAPKASSSTSSAAAAGAEAVAEEPAGRPLEPGVKVCAMIASRMRVCFAGVKACASRV
jgi:hypothetical protein